MSKYWPNEWSLKDWAWRPFAIISILSILTFMYIIHCVFKFVWIDLGLEKFLDKEEK